MAEAERARRDPVNIELEKIKEREAQQVALLAQQAAAEQEKNNTVDDAVDRWIATLKYARLAGCRFNIVTTLCTNS